MSKLRELRKQKGLSQWDLSVLTKIHVPAISLMENGHLKAFPGWRRRLARALGVPVEEIFPNDDFTR